MSETERKQRNPLERHEAEKLAEIGEKQKEAIKSRLDQAEKEHKERQSEVEAYINAKELAKESDSNKDKDQSPAPHERRRGAPSKKQLKESFNNQMKTVQGDMRASDRIFSKFLHTPAVEKTSEFISSTVARPNAMLSGSIAAFLCIALLYFIAHHYGYRLSGFETIAAFVLGWLLGIAYDYLSNLIRRK